MKLKDVLLDEYRSIAMGQEYYSGPTLYVEDMFEIKKVANMIETFLISYDNFISFAGVEVMFSLYSIDDILNEIFSKDTILDYKECYNHLRFYLKQD